jgi:hypothetical protein
MLRQEGLAAAFAGRAPQFAADDLARARSVITRFVDARISDAYPTVFVCMYGDEAAESVGYPRLGLPPRAGFEVGLADSLEQGVDPIAALGRGHPMAVAE